MQQIGGDTLEERRTRVRATMTYGVVHSQVAIPVSVYTLLQTCRTREDIAADTAFQ